MGTLSGQTTLYFCLLFNRFERFNLNRNNFLLKQHIYHFKCIAHCGKVSFFSKKQTGKSHVTRNYVNDLRKIICLRKSKVSVETHLVSRALEKLAEHAIHSLPCFYTSDVIYLLL